ncbi:MarR family transcriptional regulator [Streptomyces coerulescens]|uniref:MarR family transcriptional regulator n=1 Tax=Streptomyces coerulescens TaxID=29304 RepID=A0ABW0CEU1_STRCD
MTTATPLLDPRVIALAHYAGRALLENVLARHGSTFQQSVTLRLVAVAEGPVDRHTLVDGVVGALKIDAAEVHSVVDELIAAELLTAQEPSAVRITEAGRERFTSTSAATAPITARIYDGIPEEDLAVAGRVLTLITERADAEFADMTAGTK